MFTSRQKLTVKVLLEFFVQNVRKARCFLYRKRLSMYSMSRVTKTTRSGRWPGVSGGLDGVGTSGPIRRWLEGEEEGEDCAWCALRRAFFFSRSRRRRPSCSNVCMALTADAGKSDGCSKWDRARLPILSMISSVACISSLMKPCRWSLVSLARFMSFRHGRFHSLLTVA